MSLDWIFRFAARTHLLAFPGLVALVLGAGLELSGSLSEGGLARGIMAPRQLVGTAAMLT